MLLPVNVPLHDTMKPNSALTRLKARYTTHSLSLSGIAVDMREIEFLSSRSFPKALWFSWSTIDVDLLPWVIAACQFGEAHQICSKMFNHSFDIFCGVPTGLFICTTMLCQGEKQRLAIYSPRALVMLKGLIIWRNTSQRKSINFRAEFRVGSR